MAEVTHSLQLLTLENLQVSLRTLARVIMGDNNAFDFLLVSQGGVCAVPEMSYCPWINSTKWRFKAKQKDKLILFPKVDLMICRVCSAGGLWDLEAGGMAEVSAAGQPHPHRLESCWWLPG